VSCQDLWNVNHDYYPKLKHSNNITFPELIPNTFRSFVVFYWHCIIVNCIFTVLPFYCATLIPYTLLPFYVFYCASVIPYTTLLFYCATVRLSVLSSLVKVQSCLLSKNNTFQKYYFSCTYTKYFKIIYCFLLTLNHSEL
jgi:hypothetical protein